MNLSNVDKLTAANSITPADITQKDIDLINALSHDEIDAIISSGTKLQQSGSAADKTLRVAF